MEKRYFFSHSTMHFCIKYITPINQKLTLDFCFGLIEDGIGLNSRETFCMEKTMSLIICPAICIVGSVANIGAWNLGSLVKNGKPRAA